MQNRNRILLLAVVLGLGLTTIAFPQAVSLNVDSVTQVGRSVSDDLDTALVCAYIGSEQSGTIEVETDGNLTLLSGDSASEVADTSVECPVSGALGGIIDVSDSACDTVVEVLDIMNASTSDWRCIPVDALGTDSMVDGLATAAAAAATSVDGLALVWDTSVALELTAAYTQRRTIGDYCAGQGTCTDLLTSDGVRNRELEPGLTTVLTSAWEVSTFGSGDSFTKCYSVDAYFNSSNEYVETQTLVWQSANGSTTVATLFDQELAGGIFSKPGERLICQIDNSAALGTATLTVQALQYAH